MENCEKNEALKIVLKKKRNKTLKEDKKITVSGEVHSIIQMYSEESGIPIKELTDLLLKYALDRLEVIYKDDYNEVGQYIVLPSPLRYTLQIAISP